MTIFIQGYKTCHRNRCHLKTKEEHQKMTCTHHHVHTKQRAERKLIIFTFFKVGVRAAYPLATLYKHNKRTKGKNRLHHPGSSCCLIHASEYRNGRLRHEVERDVDAEEDNRQRTEPAARFTLSYHIVSEYYHNERHQTDFRTHI